jgi:LysW-gamma-L-alpha-aminoadipyl-6-phosphate/LysW-L-glutamyl-5-phosphate reductase
MRVSVVGAGGYVGGELLRILADHPYASLAQATSDRLAGRPVSQAHPNLHGVLKLAFCRVDELKPCDVLLLATPHGVSMTALPQLEHLAPSIVDLSADFRLRDPALFTEYYGTPHATAHLLESFTPGIPELFADRLTRADRIAVPGCMANAAILALAPIASTGLVDGTVWVDARTGSSGSGSGDGAGDAASSRHAERSGAMRVFAPTRHRHQAEIGQATGLSVAMSATGVEAVRGVQVLARVNLKERVTEGYFRGLYKSAYEKDPFIRIVARKRGTFRYPDPKILSGSNFCDVGFALGADGMTVLLISALDNLVKGGAGNAVQCLNIRAGWPQRSGLTFPGLHPA